MGIREHILEEAKKEGLEEGLERGLEQGEHRGLKMSIAKLLAKGFSSEEVVELLEISPVLVEEVLVEMGGQASDD